MLWTISVAAALRATDLQAQSFGVELHNTMLLASGGLTGASLPRPQELQSVIAGNPATLSQFRGTQFAMGGVGFDCQTKKNFTLDECLRRKLMGRNGCHLALRVWRFRVRKSVEI